MKKRFIILFFIAIIILCCLLNKTISSEYFTKQENHNPKIKIYGTNQGGFANCIFNKMAQIVLCILFDNIEIVKLVNQEEINHYIKNSHKINDSYFLEIIKAKTEKNENILDKKEYYLNGFHQYDDLYVKYKPKIIDYIHHHPDEKMFAAHSDKFWNTIDFIQEKETIIYDLVINVRLGDFVPLGWVIHPNSVKTILDKIKRTEGNHIQNVCIISEKIKTDIELKYIEYIQNVFPNTVLEQNELLIDYNIMRNAKRIVCSCSTLSWAAVFFGRKDQFVYFPNYEHRYFYETFRKVHNRWETYEIARISEKELHDFSKK